MAISTGKHKSKYNEYDWEDILDDLSNYNINEMSKQCVEQLKILGYGSILRDSLYDSVSVKPPTYLHPI